MSSASAGVDSSSSWKDPLTHRTSVDGKPGPPFDASIAHYEASPMTLEVMYGTEMSRLLQSSATVTGAALCLSIAGVLVARYKSVGTNPASQNVPSYLLIVEIVGSSILLFVMAAIALLFGARIFRVFSRNRTNRQLLVLVLVCSICVSLIPTRAIAELVTVSEDIPSTPTLMVDVIRTSITTAVVIIYTWMTVRSCRESHALDDQRATKPMVNLGNAFVLLLVSAYVMFRVVTSSLFKVAYASIPFQSFIAFLNIVSTSSSKSADAGQVICICTLTAMEILIVIAVARSNRATESFMNSADLTEYRLESIAHRFFKMSAGFLFLPLPLIALMQFGFPTQRMISVFTSSGFLILSPPVGGVAFGLILFAFGFREAFVSLPSDTDGFGTWMRDKTTTAGPGEKPGNIYSNPAIKVTHELPSLSQPTNTLTYRAIDNRDPDRGQPTLEPKCFSLESAVLMFNLSWLVYTYGTVGFSPAKPEDFGNGEYRVTKHIQNLEHDVHVLIVESAERIAVAFKGSNSIANARTDKNTKKVNAVHAFKGENSPTAKALPGIHLNADSTTWRGCKVHRGYATAYASIRVELIEEISKVFNTNNRPIFVCGHSSGGAMAALCSFELGTIGVLSGPNHIAAYSFGSPRFGNSKFAEVCDGLVQNHWRCVVAGDSTVSMPLESGYSHVGNMAMFTRNGQLTLEKVVRLRWWQSERSSHPLYKLTSYYCALKTWAESHSGQSAQEIGLWNWPIDETTSALFKAVPRPQTALLSRTKTPQARDVEGPTAARAEGGSPHKEPESLDDIVAFSK